MVLIPAVIIFLDQWTKSWVRANLAMGETYMPWKWLEGFATITHWYNRGVAFGMFQGGGTIFILLPIIIILGILIYFSKVEKRDWLVDLALSFELGGAIGNFIDRVRLGHVTDLISVGKFPVFNVADSFITVGVILLILGVWLEDRREKAALASAPAEPSDGMNDQ